MPCTVRRSVMDVTGYFFTDIDDDQGICHVLYAEAFRQCGPFGKMAGKINMRTELARKFERLDQTFQHRIAPIENSFPDFYGAFRHARPIRTVIVQAMAKFYPFVIRFQLLQEIPQYMCYHKDTSFLSYLKLFIISMFLIQTSWLVFQLLLLPNEKRQNGCHFQGYKFFS